MAVTAQDLVSREVCYCVSSLVSTLAQNCAAVEVNEGTTRELDDLAYQAMELAAPVADYEEAARDNGYELAENGEWYGSGTIEQELSEGLSGWDDVATLCWDNSIEPYDREVYEHWIVSDWLADRLIEKGEKVDKDFAGMTVWARTTTGQAIYCDHVIEQITAEVNKA